MSKFYSQKSYQDKLGTCKDTIASSGCLITSCCNLFPRLIYFKKTPPELNEYCKKNGLYSNGCLLNFAALANKLKMTYIKTSTKPKTTCIAETDHYKAKGVPQHFFMWKSDGTIIDPLDKNPDWKKNPYRIISYRVFKKIKKVEPKSEAQGFEIQKDGTVTTTLNPIPTPNNSTANEVHEAYIDVSPKPTKTPILDFIIKLINLIIKKWKN